MRSSPYQGEAGWGYPLRLVTGLAQRFRQHRVHSLAALHDIVIGEAQDMVAARGEVGWVSLNLRMGPGFRRGDRRGWGGLSGTGMVGDVSRWM